MGTLSDFAENAVVKHLTREAAYSPAATLYLALCTADPTDAATGASMSEAANSGSYARTAITFGAASSRRVTQSGTVTFPAASGSWGTITHWAIVTSGTYGSGDVLASGSLAVPKSVVSGNTPSVASGEVWVEITASTGLSNYAANGLLDRMFRNQAFTISANYLAVATATLSDTTTGTTAVEPSGNNYSRLNINASGGAQPSWEAVSGNAVQNANAWVMPTPSGSWGTIVAAFIVDASTVGNILMYDNGITDQLVSSGDTVQYATGALDFSQV
jgi:hypothetical protein